jgi:hypothetical protein
VVEVERIDETSRERVRALLEARVAPGEQLGEVSVNSAAELVSFAHLERGERRSISLALAGSALVRAA